MEYNTDKSSIHLVAARPRSKSKPASETLKDEQEQAILALLEQGWPSRKKADTLGVGIRVVAGYRATHGPHAIVGAAPKVGRTRLTR
jgi:hypothetical protein